MSILTGQPRVAPRMLLTAVATVCRFGLAAVLLSAGAFKLVDPPGSVRTVRAFRILPEAVVAPVGYGLPALELGLGLLLLVGLGTRVAAALAAALMVAFLIGISAAWVRGLSIDCGCFGGGGDVAPGTADYVPDLIRDTATLAAALLLVWRPATPLSLDHIHRTTPPR